MRLSTNPQAVGHHDGRHVSTVMASGEGSTAMLSQTLLHGQGAQSLSLVHTKGSTILVNIDTLLHCFGKSSESSRKPGPAIALIAAWE